jgi:hypothetical protein
MLTLRAHWGVGSCRRRRSRSGSSASSGLAMISGRGLWSDDDHPMRYRPRSRHAKSDPASSRWAMLSIVRWTHAAGRVVVSDRLFANIPSAVAPPAANADREPHARCIPVDLFVTVVSPP